MKPRKFLGCGAPCGTLHEMATQKRKCTDAAGFSLTELLTVLGIVGILSAIVFPVFFTVRENGRKTACASNLRQIGQAFTQYVSDYDGVFPGALSGSSTTNVHRIRGPIWMHGLLPYTGKTLLVCPDRELPGILGKAAVVAAARGSASNPRISGYAMNYRISERVPNATPLPSIHLSGQSEARFRFPAVTVLAFDARVGITAMNYPDVDTWAYESAEMQAKWPRVNRTVWSAIDYRQAIRQQNGGARRHGGGGANYVFADGHVKWLKPEQLSPSPTSDGSHPGFGL